jgi:8-oxo-dGTP pyrophosphatase MutT (NUDIX family)
MISTPRPDASPAEDRLPASVRRGYPAGVGSLSIAGIEEAIRRGVATRPLSSPTRKRAAVAIVLRERGGARETEVLLIRRAERAGDPWSGHVALPGGRAAPEDASIEATAIREAREEVGIDLAAPGVRLLGRLPDFEPMRRITGLAITPVVFEVAGDPPLSPDAREVAATAWVPLAALASGALSGRMVYWWRPLRRIPLPVPLVVGCWRWNDFTIWGLTYRILESLFLATAAA